MRALIALPFAAIATPVLAHGGHLHAPDPFPWTIDPWIVVPLSLLALLYAAGSLRLLRRSRHGHMGHASRMRLFWTGWLVLALTLVSPLHAAGERSFFLHMVEHEMLMLVATPLVVLATPLPVMLWAFPGSLRRRLGGFGAAARSSAVWRAMSGPFGATIGQAAMLWLWHTPKLFNRALESDGWHIAQHLSFIATALIFWNAVLGRRGARGQDTALAALCLFVTSLIGGALGALMAVSESPWYAAYARMGEAPFGLSAIEDQQLAGLVMWVPGGLVHATGALLVAATLLRGSKAGADAS